MWFKKNYVKATTAEDLKKEQKLKNLSIAYRYPRTFIWITTLGSILIFFSRPIYDLCFSSEKVHNDTRGPSYPKNFEPRWIKKAKKEMEKEKKIIQEINSEE